MSETIIPKGYLINQYQYARRYRYNSSGCILYLDPDLHSAPHNQVFKPNCSRYLSDLGFLKNQFNDFLYFFEVVCINAKLKMHKIAHSKCTKKIR